MRLLYPTQTCGDERRVRPRKEQPAATAEDGADIPSPSVCGGDIRTTTSVQIITMFSLRHLPGALCARSVLLLSPVHQAAAAGGAFGVAADVVFGSSHWVLDTPGQFSVTSGFQNWHCSSVLASGSLASGTPHSFSAAEMAAGCSPPVCRAARSTIRMWDTISIHNGFNAGFTNPWLTIDGNLAGLAATATVRFYAGSPATGIWSTIDSLPKQALTSGTTEFNGEAALLPPFGDDEYFIYAELETQAIGGPTWASVADFGHTLHFNWQLPDGATYTSASGMFMTAAVPEPGTMALGAFGVLLLGGVLRRRAPSRSGSVRREAKAAMPALFMLCCGYGLAQNPVKGDLSKPCRFQVASSVAKANAAICPSCSVAPSLSRRRNRESPNAVHAIARARSRATASRGCRNRARLATAASA